MAGFLTSYAKLFSAQGPTGEPLVSSVEIPLIQRDYAQGRTDPNVTDIRDRFLDVLFEALCSGQDVGLDFVYGDVENGRLQLLDGQQRLTTLFLLHWYVGYRAGQLEQRQAWMNFSYATRPSARLFCEELVGAVPPSDVADPAAWVVDQPWYLYVWTNDPTIQAMLVMLDAIHKRFGACDPQEAWQRLVSTNKPAITFQLLPIEDMGSGEELYIKMNSRGKPLTAFENFKARFERAISWAGTKATEFDHRIDGAWSDILWRYRGDDDIVDDEFLRYLAFITDICEWQAGRLPSGRLEPRALRLFGSEGPEAEASLDFLFQAFDTWVDADVNDEFTQLFTASRPEAKADPSRLLLFGNEIAINLFDACCRQYGTARFTYGRTLLLFAVLLDRADPSPDFRRRIRVVRNLIEASESELRPNRLPSLVADVRRIIQEGSVETINGFNKAQAEDEQAKWTFLDENPHLTELLYQLEDHQLLRGSLQAFELDPSTFEHRAVAFETLMASPTTWANLTGALLAAGNYGRKRNHRDMQFGSPTNTEPWRNLLTGTTRDNLKPTARALATVLDAVKLGTVEQPALTELREAFLQERTEEKELDWRYYLVKYQAMREGASGIYASVGGNMGYQLCMMNKTQLNGYYQDPYLSAVARTAGLGSGIVAGSAAGPWFIGGYVEDTDRWLLLTKSRAGIRTVSNGWALRAPTNPDLAEAFRNVCDAFAVGENLRLVVPQAVSHGRHVDSLDRVEAGVALLKALAEADL